MGYEDKSTGGNSEMNFLIKKDTWKKKKKTWEDRACLLLLLMSSYLVHLRCLEP